MKCLLNDVAMPCYRATKFCLRFPRGREDVKNVLAYYDVPLSIPEKLQAFHMRGWLEPLIRRKVAEASSGQRRDPVLLLGKKKEGGNSRLQLSKRRRSKKKRMEDEEEGSQTSGGSQTGRSRKDIEFIIGNTMMSAETAFFSIPESSLSLGLRGPRTAGASSPSSKPRGPRHHPSGPSEDDDEATRIGEAQKWSLYRYGVTMNAAFGHGRIERPLIVEAKRDEYSTAATTQTMFDSYRKACVTSAKCKAKGTLGVLDE